MLLSRAMTCSIFGAVLTGAGVAGKVEKSSSRDFLLPGAGRRARKLNISTQAKRHPRSVQIITSCVDVIAVVMSTSESSFEPS